MAIPLHCTLQRRLLKVIQQRHVVYTLFSYWETNLTSRQFTSSLKYCPEHVYKITTCEQLPALSIFPRTVPHAASTNRFFTTSVLGYFPQRKSRPYWLRTFPNFKRRPIESAAILAVAADAERPENVYFCTCPFGSGNEVRHTHFNPANRVLNDCEKVFPEDEAICKLMKLKKKNNCNGTYKGLFFVVW